MPGPSDRSRPSSCCDAWQTHAIPPDLPDASASGQRAPGHRGSLHVGDHRDGAAEAVADDKVRLLVAASGGILAIAFGSGLFSYAQIFITSSIGYRMVYALRRELFSHLQTLSLSFHNQSRSGDLLTKIAGDTNTLKDIFADSILKFTTYVL